MLLLLLHTAFAMTSGLWRGSTVAVKTMILPAKMSGAEKRERMAIMEAAISSTMNHPNIGKSWVDRPVSGGCECCVRHLLVWQSFLQGNPQEKGDKHPGSGVYMVALL